MATAQQIAAAKAKYPDIVNAVNRLASIGAQPAQASPEQWMSNWNAQSQANYDAAGPQIMATADMRRQATPSRSPVTLGPFPASQTPPQELAKAFAARRRQTPTTRLSAEELAANAAVMKDRRAIERDQRYQQKQFAKQARTFKRMAGLGYNDGLIAMPMMSPQDQFAMEMTRAAMQHGNQMDIDRLGLDRQQLENLNSQFQSQLGLNKTIAGNQFTLGQGQLDLQKTLGQGQLDVQKTLGQGQIDTQRELGLKGYDTQRQLGQQQADTARYGYDTQYDMADMQAQLAQAEQAQRAQQFAAQMERLTRQDDRQHAYNKRDFGRDVLEADRLFQQGTLQADRQDAYRRAELERLNRALQMQGNVQEHEMRMQDVPESRRGAMGILAGRPDLQAQYLAGGDMQDLASKINTQLTPEMRNQIMANSGGNYETIAQQLRMLGLNGSQLDKEFKQITGVSHWRHKYFGDTPRGLVGFFPGLFKPPALPGAEQ